MLIQDRNKAQSRKWAIFTSYSIVETVHKARDMGWAEKKVQVRAEEDYATGIRTYSIEPFEKECKCPSILIYDDYFTPPNDEDLTVTE